MPGADPCGGVGGWRSAILKGHSRSWKDGLSCRPVRDGSDQMSRLLVDEVLPGVRVSEPGQALRRCLLESRTVRLVVLAGYQQDWPGYPLHRDRSLRHLRGTAQVRGSPAERDRAPCRDRGFHLRRDDVRQVWQFVALIGPACYRSAENLQQGPGQHRLADALGYQSTADHADYR